MKIEDVALVVTGKMAVPTTIDDLNWVDKVLNEIPELAQFDKAQVYDAIPTLNGASDEMDVSVANVVLIQAARWLEYVDFQLAKQEAKHILSKGATKMFERKLNFKYKKKLDAATEEEIDTLNKLERAELEAEAHLLVLRGVKQSLDNVRTAASRTITRHTKSNMALADQ